MNTDPTQDAHSLGIALRLAQAQNSELRKELADQHWQPIETAPKDGTEVVVVDFDGDRFIASSTDGKNWYDCAYPVYCPTHWMPLPAPPMADKRDIVADNATMSDK